MQTPVEQALTELTPTVDVSQLLRALTPTAIGLTLAIVVLGYVVTWLIRRGMNHGRFEVAPAWVNKLLTISLPLVFWVLASVAVYYHKQMSVAPIWLDFVKRLFLAWFLVRLFLYVVRRALPEGARRSSMERLSMAFIWGLMALDYVGKLQGLLDVLDSWSVMLGKNRLSVLHVLTLTLVVLVVWLVVKWLINELEYFLLKKPHPKFASFDLSARMIFVRISKGVLMLLAILLSLSASGIDLTVLSVFGGALGVGVGLGLQKIASNYVSGFVMLLERSVRIGDLVSTSDGTRGFVRSINARYTLIQGSSGDEVLVPNEHLVTNPVVNWSLSDKINWQSTQIPVNYDIDLELIMAKMAAAVAILPRVAPEPKPNVFLAAISDKGYILEVTWWLVDPENGRLNMVSEVNLTAWRVLKENNVDVFTLKPPTTHSE